MEILKEKIKDNEKFILLLITSVLFTSIFMILIYEYTGPTKSQKALNSIIKDINTLNSNLNKGVQDSVINSKYTIETLQENINLLQQINIKLSSTVITDNKLSTLYFNISSSINSTQNLYIYCLNLLDSTNLNSNWKSELTSYQKECIENYKLVSSFGNPINYTKKSELFYSNLINYVTNNQKLKIKNEVNNIQTQNFFTYINNYVQDFSTLLEDLEPAIKQVRNDNRSIDILIKDISEKEVKFLDIKRKVDFVSIPEGCKSYYDSLVDSLNIYSKYLTAIKTALIYEKSSNNYKDNKKLIDKNYDNAYSKLEDTKLSLDKLIKSLENN